MVPGDTSDLFFQRFQVDMQSEYRPSEGVLFSEDDRAEIQALEARMLACFADFISSSLDFVAQVGEARGPAAQDALTRHLELSPEHLAKMSGSAGWKTIRRLNLGTCGLSDISHLGEALTGAVLLSHLDLRNNPVGDAGAEAIAAAITNGSSLAFLNLSGCKVTAKGAEVLGHALASSTTLSELSLFDNPTGPGVLETVLCAVKAGCPIKRLDLRDTKLQGAQGVLTELLEAASSLEVLQLQYNGLGDRGAAALARGLQTNTTLHTLNVGYNEISPAAKQALRSAWGERSGGLQTEP